MSHILSSDASASARNITCKSAEKQTFMTSYFASQSNEPKRKRRNLEVPSTDTGSAKKPGLCDSRTADVEKDEDPCQLDDDKCETRLKEGSMPVCSTPTVYSSDLDSCDVISPSPVATINNSLTLSGRMKRESDQYVNTQVNINTNAADQSKTAVIPSSVPDSISLHCVKSSAGQPLSHKLTFEHQTNTEEVGSVAPLHKRADRLSMSNEDEDVADSELLSADIPSPMEVEADTEFSSELPVAEENTGDSTDKSESRSLQSDCQVLPFMEKVR